MNNIKESDQEVYNLILQEHNREENGVELIPSENFVSRAVLQAIGSVFTNKYSEGYPKRRYYGGQEFVDLIENLAIKRAKDLFGAEHVNVQPYSGSPANQAVFFALLKIGDKFMGLDMSCGGHLTHGSPVNFSGIQYKPIPYYVDRDTELIDMDKIRTLARKERPKMIISSLTAYPRKLEFKEFQEICEEVDAYHLADISHIAGLIVGGVHESPFPFTDVVTTTSHKTLRGPRGAIIMCKIEDRLHDKYNSETEKNLAQLIDSAVFPGLQGGPHDHITAAKAVAFSEAMKPEFKEYAHQIVKNAKAMADELMAQGIKLVTNGTDNHLMLIDLRPKGLHGKGSLLQKVMDRANITVNKNSVPFQEESPFNPSGLRLGTPAVTTRGMKEDEMRVIAQCVVKVIDNYKDETVLEKTKQEIIELVKDFPIYPNFVSLK
ncbi:serine hydroxymethyltransferase [Candidatus Bathyarchaeota archaeon]|nr:serine hydroxymethyltransferase [Candidatus Bathyarchaeota archaeon]